MNWTSHWRRFWLASSLESALAVIAWGGAWFTGFSLGPHFRWHAGDALLGLVATLPCFGLFLWMTVSSWPPLVQIRTIMETGIRPFFASWTIGQLAIISVLAGVGEELLFRGLLQGGLTETIGAWPALGLASVIFGATHCITKAYAVIVMIIGVYLGGLWLFSGNLLTPMITHAVYDFVALVYFLRGYRPAIPGGHSP